MESTVQTGNPKVALSGDRILDLMRDGVIGLDPEYRVTYINSTGQMLLSMYATDVIGRKLEDILPNFFKALNPHFSINDDRPHFRPLATSVNIQNHVMNLEFNIHESVEGNIILFRDIKDQDTESMQITRLNATLMASQELLRHKNEELNKSLQQVEKMHESLAEVESLKSEIIDNTSHELRTPLNSMIGSLQLVKEGLCDSREEEMDCVNNALDSAQVLLTLINDMLEISKIEAGKVKLMIDNHRLTDIFDDVYSMTKVLAERKNLALEFRHDDEDERTVRVDGEKARQLLINLVSNAIKFTDEGKVMVWAEVDVENPDMIKFYVNDTGIGLVGGQGNEIFEKFTQLDASNTRRFNGTGLGLAITRHLVELMGGSIELHSEGRNLGTTAIFTLPAGTHAVETVEDEDAEIEIGEDILPSTF